MILLTVAIILLVPVITVALLYSQWVKRLMERMLAHSDDKQAQTENADTTTAEDSQASVKADEEFTALMARLQVTPAIIPDQSGENDTTASFDFQGGHFIAMLSQGTSVPTDNSVSISFMNCYSLPAEHLSRAGELANIINNLMAPIKCAYILNPDLGEVDFSLHATDIYFHDDEMSAEHMRHLLLNFFRVQRMLFERFEQMKSDSPSDVEANRLIFGHQLYAISRLEITEQTEPWSEMLFQPQKLTLGEFLLSLFGLPPESDTILYINGAKISENSDEFYQTPLLDGMIEGEGPDAHIVSNARSITLRSRSRETREVIISLRAEKIDDRLISIRVNAMISALPVAPFRAPASLETKPQSRSVVIGVPCVTPEAFMAEAKYMADELGLVEKCKNPDAAYNLYWGKVLYTDGRFPEALHYLHNAYSVMVSAMENPELMAPEYCETFYDLCYFLGVVNCAMGRYHAAYYYLDLIVNQHRVMWTEQYICCLMALRDPRVGSITVSLLENVRRQQSETDEADHEAAAQLTPFIEFLERQQIVLDIRAGKTEEARRALSKILSDDPDSTFAIYWLSKI